MVLTRAQISSRYAARHPDKIRAYREAHRQHYRDIAKAYRERRKDYYKDRHEHRLTFKGERHIIDRKPRTGICSRCGRLGYTHIHHNEYIEEDHLACTIELCPVCHSKITASKNPHAFKKGHRYNT